MTSINARFINFFDDINRIIRRMEALRNEMANFSSNCNVARGVVAIGAVGFSVMTGGIGAAVLGSLFGLASINSADEEATKKCIASVKRLLNSFAIEMTSMEPIIDQIARVLEKNEEESAVLQSTRMRSSATINHAFILSNQERPISDLVVTVSRLREVNFVRLISSIRATNGRLADSVKRIFELLPILENYVNDPENHRDSALMTSLVSCLELFVHLVTFVSIGDCLREHPTVELINEIVPKLESIKRDYQSILDQLNGIRIAERGFHAQIGLRA